MAGHSRIFAFGLGLALAFNALASETVFRFSDSAGDTFSMTLDERTVGGGYRWQIKIEVDGAMEPHMVTVQDEDKRILRFEFSDGSTHTFEPHNCEFVVGAGCEYSETMRDGAQIRRKRINGFRRGVWDASVWTFRDGEYHATELIETCVDEARIPYWERWSSLENYEHYEYRRVGAQCPNP